MKTFFSYLNSIRAVSLCIWKQSQLPTKQPQQYIDGSKMKYVYNLIFLQLPGCLKSNYSYFTYFHIYVLRPHPQVSLRHLMGVLPGGTTGPAWSTVPHLPRLYWTRPSAPPPAVEVTVHCESGEIPLPAVYSHLDVCLFSGCLKEI